MTVMGGGWALPRSLISCSGSQGGFLGGASGEEPAYQCRRHETWIRSLGKRAWQPTLAFLPGESHGQRSLVGYSPQGCKKSDTTEVT